MPPIQLASHRGRTDALLLAADAEIGAAADRVSRRGRCAFAGLHLVAGDRDWGLVCRRSAAHRAQRCPHDSGRARANGHHLLRRDGSVGGLNPGCGGDRLRRALRAGRRPLWLLCRLLPHRLRTVGLQRPVDSRAANPGDHCHARRIGVLPRTGADPGRGRLARLRRAIHHHGRRLPSAWAGLCRLDPAGRDRLRFVGRVFR